MTKEHLLYVENYRGKEQNDRYYVWKYPASVQKMLWDIDPFHRLKTEEVRSGAKKEWLKLGK